MAWIKNIEHEKCLAVTDEVSYQPGQIVSKTLAIVMPAKKPHAVLATEPFKMLLIVLFPEEV